MSKFVLTAKLKLASPSVANIDSVRNDIVKRLKNVDLGVNVKLTEKDVRQVKNVTKELAKTKDVLNDAASSAEAFGKNSALAVKRFSGFVVGTFAFRALINSLKESFSRAVEFEKELTKISQVTNIAVKDLNRLSNQISEVAKKYGVAGSDILDASRILAQAGFSIRQVELAMEALAKTELSPTFGKITETAESSVAIFQQFKISANDLEKALGSINEVSAQFAVESKDITSAVRRAGAAFVAAGGDIKSSEEGLKRFQEFASLFTSVRATTRESAETIATGLRTIFTRIQRPTTLKFMRNLGIELLDTQGKFVGAFEAVNRLNKGLQGLSTNDPQFAQIVEQLGGIRQITKIIPLIKSFTTAQTAYNVALMGTDSISEDVAAAQGTLAVQFSKVREEFDALVRGIAGDFIFKKLLEQTLHLTTSLIKLADALRPIIPLIAIGGVASIGGGLKSYTKGFKSNIFTANTGGIVPGSGNTDTVPAMLTPGEFVIRKNAAKAIGFDKLSNINKFADGGQVQDYGAVFLDPKNTKQTINIPITQEELASSQKLLSSTGLTKTSALAKFAGIDARFKLAGLPETASTELEGLLRQSIQSGLRIGSERTAQRLGIPQQVYNPDVENKIGLNTMIGKMFEGVLTLMNKGPFDVNASSTFDFPFGINGPLGSVFSGFQNIPTDAKYSYGSAEQGRDVRTSLKKKVINYNRQLLQNKLGVSGPSSLRDLGKEGALKKVDDRLAQTDLTSLQRSRLEELKLKLGSGAKRLKISGGNDSVAKLLGFEKLNSGGNVDTVPAMLTPGEFVINKDAANKIGLSTLHKLNNADKIQGFNKGGSVSYFASGGDVEKTFPYEAMDVYGKSMSGSVSAKSGSEAQRKIRDMGLYITKLVEDTEKESGGFFSYIKSFFLSSKRKAQAASKEDTDTSLSISGPVLDGTVSNHSSYLKPTGFAARRVEDVEKEIEDREKVVRKRNKELQIEAQLQNRTEVFGPKKLKEFELADQPIGEDFRAQYERDVAEARIRNSFAEASTREDFSISEKRKFNEQLGASEAQLDLQNVRSKEVIQEGFKEEQANKARKRTNKTSLFSRAKNAILKPEDTLVEESLGEGVHGPKRLVPKTTNRFQRGTGFLRNDLGQIDANKFGKALGGLSVVMALASDKTEGLAKAMGASKETAESLNSSLLGLSTSASFGLQFLQSESKAGRVTGKAILGAGIAGAGLGFGDNQISQGNTTAGVLSSSAGLIGGGLAAAGPYGALAGLIGAGAKFSGVLDNTSYGKGLGLESAQTTKGRTDLTNIGLKIGEFATDFSKEGIDKLSETLKELETLPDSILDTDITTELKKSAPAFVKNLRGALLEGQINLDDLLKKNRGGFLELFTAAGATVTELQSLSEKGREYREIINNEAQARLRQLEILEKTTGLLSTYESLLDKANSSLDAFSGKVGSRDVSGLLENFGRGQLFGKAFFEAKNITNKLGEGVFSPQVEQFKSAKQASEVFPRVLAQLKTGPNPTASDLLEKLERGFIGSDANFDLIEPIAKGFLSGLDSDRNPGKLAEALQDIQGTTEKFRSAIDAPLKQTPEIAKRNQEINKSLVSLLDRASKAQEQANSARLNKLDVSESQRESLLVANRRQVNLRSSQGLAINQQRFETVAGGSAGLSVDQLVARNLSASRNLKSKETDLATVTEASAREKLAKEINREERVLRETNNALEFLAKNSKEAALLQQEISRLEQNRQSQRDFATSFVFGSREDRNKIQKDIQNTKIAARTGSVEQFSGEQRQGILSIAKQFENQQNVAFGKNDKGKVRTGKEFIESFLPKNLQGNSKEQQKLIGRLEEAFKVQNEALDGQKKIFETFRDEAIGQFTDTVNEFKIVGNQLAQALAAFPSEVKHTVKIEPVEVIINGHEVLKELQPGLEKMVVRTVNDQLSKSFPETHVPAASQSYTAKSYGGGVK